MDYEDKVLELKVAGYEQAGPYRDWYAPHLGGRFEKIDDALIDKRRKEHVRNIQLEERLWNAIEKTVRNHVTYEYEGGTVGITLQDFGRLVSLLDEEDRM